MNFLSNLKKSEYNKNHTIEYKDDEIIINILCNDCKLLENNIFMKSHYNRNLKCLECIINSIINLKIGKYNILINNVKIPNQDLENIVELKKLFLLYKKFELEISKINCLDKINCKFFSYIIMSLNKSSLENFLDYFINCNDTKYNFQSFNKTPPQCNKCYLKIIKNIKKFNEKIQNSNIFRVVKFLNIGDISELLNNLFIGINSCKNIELKKEILDKNLVNEYYIESYSLYHVKIFKEKDSMENIYEISLNIGDKPLEVYEKIIELVKKKLIKLEFQNLLSIDELLLHLIENTKRELKLNYGNLNLNEIENISILASTRIINLNKIFPLLIDKYIEEIYLDNSFSNIYIDHQIVGRCNTNILLNDIEIESIKTFLRVSSNKRLDFSNPSLKFTLMNKFFNCRFTIDIKPLNLFDISLDIRKMNKKIFTLPELIYRNMLSSEIAAFLYYCLINKINITVTGETSSGKTTLINSLDILVPTHYRKIYIEEAPESLNLVDMNIHQTKYIVNSQFENSKGINNKSSQIYKLLHRNPDYIYLGEILNKEESLAMFHCLSAGLRGLQTIHARDLESLINRWNFHFKIDASCFNDLDIIILLKKIENKRFIYKISEIRFEHNKIIINNIYSYDISTNKWIRNTDFLNINTIKRLVLKEKELVELNKIINFFKNIFDVLVSEKRFDLIFQINLFKKILYEFYRYREENKSFEFDKYQIL